LIFSTKNKKDPIIELYTTLATNPAKDFGCKTSKSKETILMQIRHHVAVMKVVMVIGQTVLMQHSLKMR